MNQLTISGRLTADPKISYTANNIAVAQFTVAVDRKYKNADGEKVTDFIPVVAWRKFAEWCDKYLQKGRKVILTGSLELREYDDKDGNKRRVAEMIAETAEFCDKKPEGEITPAKPQKAENRPTEAAESKPAAQMANYLDSDDFPF